MMVMKKGKTFNPVLANNLEDVLNIPYNHTEGPECPGCSRNNADNFKITGNVISDGLGLFVEKHCKECNSFTEDGHGDFFEVYDLDGNNPIRLDDERNQLLFD